jgi:hypothetical protein
VVVGDRYQAAAKQINSQANSFFTTLFVKQPKQHIFFFTTICEQPKASLSATAQITFSTEFAPRGPPAK